MAATNSVANNATHLFLVVRRLSEDDGADNLMSLEAVSDMDEMRTRALANLKATPRALSVTMLRIDANILNEDEEVIYISPDFYFLDKGDE